MNRGDWEQISNSLAEIVEDELYAPTEDTIRHIPEGYSFAKDVVKQAVRKWIRAEEKSYLVTEKGDEIHIVRPEKTNLYIGPEGSACTVEVQVDYGRAGIDFLDALEIAMENGGTEGICGTVAVARDTISPSALEFWNDLIFGDKYIFRMVAEADFGDICDALTPELTSISDLKPAAASESIETYAELCETIYEIAGQHYVRGMYPDSSGDIGTTFEALLNIDENNIQESDLTFAELKTQRHGSMARQTMFSKAPPKSHRQLWKRELIKTVGYTDDKGRKALRTTITGDKYNSQGLRLEFNHQDERLEVHHRNEGFCFGWPFSTLESVFKSKMDGLVVVKADKKTHHGEQYFWYNQAEYFGEIDSGTFIENIENGTIKVDTRMYIKEDGSIRDRGTSFRVNNMSDLEHLYSTHRSILTQERAAELAGFENTPEKEQKTLPIAE